MTMAPDWIIQVTYRDELYGQTILTTHHLAVVDPPATVDDLAALQALADLLGDAAGVFVDDWSAELTEDVTRKACRCQVIYPVRGVYREKVVADTGDLPGPAAPANLALSVTRQTSLPGRRGVGRVQLAGLPMSGLVAGVWSGGAQLAAKDAMDNFVGFLNEPTFGALYRWVVYNKGLGLGSNYAPVQNWVPQDTGRTMHRRTVRLGI